MAGQGQVLFNINSTITVIAQLFTLMSSDTNGSSLPKSVPGDRTGGRCPLIIGIADFSRRTKISFHRFILPSVVPAPALEPGRVGVSLETYLSQL